MTRAPTSARTQPPTIRAPHAAPAAASTGSSGARQQQLCLLLVLSFIGLTPVAVFGEAVDGFDGAGDNVKQAAFVLLFGWIAATSVRRSGAVIFLRIAPPLALLLAWLWLSVTWAIDPAVAARRTAFASIVVLSVSYLIAEMPLDEVLRVLLATCAAIVVVDWIAVALLPLAVHQAGGPEPELAGDWRGMHAHKNEAGAFLGVFLILLIHRCVQHGICLKMALLALLTVGFLYMSRSKTAIGFLPIAVAAGASSLWLHRYRAAKVAAVVGAAAFGALCASSSIAEQVTNYLSDPAALTGRVQIWPLMLEYASDHLWLGSGYGSFWSVDNAPIYEYTSGWLTTINHAHNGYLNLLVQIGLGGLLITLAVFIVQPVSRFAFATFPRPATRFYLAATFTFIYLNNLLESSLLDRANPVWMLLLVNYALLDKAVIDRPAGGWRSRESTPARSAPLRPRGAFDEN